MLAHTIPTYFSEVTMSIDSMVRSGDPKNHSKVWSKTRRVRLCRRAGAPIQAN